MTGKLGVVIEVNAETDFVAKNADFQAFVKTCADTVIEKIPLTWTPCLPARLPWLRADRRRAFEGEDSHHRREHQDPPLRPL